MTAGSTKLYVGAGPEGVAPSLGFRANERSRRAWRHGGLVVCRWAGPVGEAQELGLVVKCYEIQKAELTGVFARVHPQSEFRQPLFSVVGEHSSLLRWVDQHWRPGSGTAPS